MECAQASCSAEALRCRGRAVQPQVQVAYEQPRPRTRTPTSPWTTTVGGVSGGAVMMLTSWPVFSIILAPPHHRIQQRQVTTRPLDYRNRLRSNFAVRG